MTLTSTIGRFEDIQESTTTEPRSVDKAPAPLPDIAAGRQSFQSEFARLMPSDWHVDGDGKLYTTVSMFGDPNRIPKGFLNATTSLNWADNVECIETAHDDGSVSLWIKAVMAGHVEHRVIAPDDAVQLSAIRAAMCARMIDAVRRRVEA